MNLRFIFSFPHPQCWCKTLYKFNYFLWFKFLIYVWVFWSKCSIISIYLASNYSLIIFSESSTAFWSRRNSRAYFLSYSVNMDSSSLTYTRSLHCFYSIYKSVEISLNKLSRQLLSLMSSLSSSYSKRIAFSYSFKFKGSIHVEAPSEERKAFFSSSSNNKCCDGCSVCSVNKKWFN